MKDELIITLKTTDSSSNIMNFVTEINKTNNLTALVLPKLNDYNNFEIAIYKLSN
jgi:hypothetical protein